MADIENLMLEHFRALRADIAAVRDEVVSLRTELRASNQHLAAFFTHEVGQDSELAAMRLRLDRIERRLDLID